MTHAHSPVASAFHRARTVAATALVIVVCALAFFMVIIPMVLGAQSYTVLTGSMSPALEPGHLIAVRDTPIEAIDVGDIVTYQIESGEPAVATHRVVGVGVDGEGDRILTTRGDANDVADEEPVRDIQIRGILVYAIPVLGYINVWATPVVKSLLITAIGVAAIGWGILVFAKDAFRRRALTRVGTAVVAAFVLGSGPLLAPAPAAASEIPLQLSADGTTWTNAPTLTLVDAADRIVPGDSRTITLWIRNASFDDASFTVTGSWSPERADLVRDVALAESLTAPDVTRMELDAASHVAVPLTISLPAEAENVTRAASAILTLTVTLSASTSSAPEPPLAGTGAELPVTLLVTAGALLATGGILLLIRGLTRRRNRRLRKEDGGFA